MTQPQRINVVLYGTSVLLMGIALELLNMPEFRVVLLAGDDPDALRRCHEAQAAVVLYDTGTVGVEVLNLLRALPHTIVIGLESDRNTLLVLHGQRHPVATVPDLAAIIRQQVAASLSDG
jgi:DNA-binding NarL/FixJ family response regulator